jgi:hypothetical protein
MRFLHNLLLSKMHLCPQKIACVVFSLASLRCHEDPRFVKSQKGFSFRCLICFSSSQDTPDVSRECHLEGFKTKSKSFFKVFSNAKNTYPFALSLHIHSEDSIKISSNPLPKSIRQVFSKIFLSSSPFL